MNITTELKQTNQEAISIAPRTAIIRNHKKKITTVKPVVDEKYGTVYQKLFLNDYVIYALLRNKHDFTSCSSTNRVQAIELAKTFRMKIEKYLSVLEQLGDKTPKYLLPVELHMTESYDRKEVISQLLHDIIDSFKRVEDKYKITTGI